MVLKFKQIDAFSDKPFLGNPAGVILLERALPDHLMQNIALEMNLSETAFLIKEQENCFSLRWFTPSAEVDLCGHATLASAFSLWEDCIVPFESKITFSTKSGKLFASYDQGWIQLDFPLEPESSKLKGEEEQELISSLGVQPVYIARNRMDILVEINDESELLSLTPDFNRLKKLNARGVIVTCKPSHQKNYDFISRCFYPALNVNEDPVTGSAHCFLVDYWSKRLNQKSLVAYQASPRSGVLKLSLTSDNRVLISGQAITVMTGELHV